MTRKLVAAIAVTLGMVGSSAPMVHAGGGGAGTAIDTFALDCYLVNGTNPAHVHSIDDQFYEGEQARTNVRLGKAQLLCTPATVTSRGNSDGRLEFVLRYAYGSDRRPGARAAFDVWTS